jgi:hypothetical protein
MYPLIASVVLGLGLGAPAGVPDVGSAAALTMAHRAPINCISSRIQAVRHGDGASGCARGNGRHPASPLFRREEQRPHVTSC